MCENPDDFSRGLVIRPLLEQQAKKAEKVKVGHEPTNKPTVVNTTVATSPNSHEKK